MPRKKVDVEVPDGQHLGWSRDTDGALRAHLFDDRTNKLVGHAELFEPEDDHDYARSYDWEPSPENSPAAAQEPDEEFGLVGMLVVLGVAFAAVKGAEHLENRRAPRPARQPSKKDRKRAMKAARAARQVPVVAPVAHRPRPATPPGWLVDPWDHRWVRWWNGYGWTGHLRPRYAQASLPAAAHTGPWPHHAPAGAVPAAQTHPPVTMSRQEWQQRARAMLLARAFSEEQQRLLAHACIDDADPAVLELQRAFASLSPEQFAERVGQLVAANPAALSAAEAQFLSIFGEGSAAQPQPSHASPRQRLASRPGLAGAQSWPPGWYDDKRGRWRWWDGRQWTHHVRP
ncbi:DUF2510 domain-containing protein [Nocardioides immobilis]|uniref:DUF2510 domain-containing protein n=1 Tax=Nocardioides immobilis TaxID=2049295 RepID=A0A417Y4M5_9ACTN|nr:DUF2510 domain-containing protein [Nocardioides immobilis]RHW27545.1 DUF2510 domain-containing protein [Nocardioides immobilis]